MEARRRVVRGTRHDHDHTESFPEAAAFPAIFLVETRHCRLWVVDENSMTPFKGTALLAKVDDE
ncbi:unnamed protein product, partial [Dovyalis caffra]